ncbi:MAG: FtsX-like permease family protein [Bacteroidales bacterium]
MNDYQLAWRNLWRNKRRTIITAASVFFAVFFALVMRSFQLGSYDRLFKNVIESYTGYLQIQQKDYFDDPVLDNGFEIRSSLLDSIGDDPNISGLVPRLQSFALAAAGSRTQGVIVMGIDPHEEDRVSSISKRLVRFRLSSEAIKALKSQPIPDRTKKLLDVYSGDSYSSVGRMLIDLDIPDDDTASVLPLMRKYASFSNAFLNENDSDAVVIGSGLSSYLKADVGDTLVMIGQGYHGATAAGKYVIKGIVRLPAPDIDNIIVYLPLNEARVLFDAPGLLTSLVLDVKKNDNRNLTDTEERLGSFINGQLTILPWQKLNELLVNQVEADNNSGKIMIGILYLVIAFGVFGTVVMMMAERRREFGMLVAIGMQKGKLAKLVSFELLLTGLLGIIAGIIVSLPVVFYGHFHPLRFTGEMGRMYEDYGFEPVMPTMLPNTYYLWQILVVLIILGIAVAYSIRKVFRINVITSLRA